jgi:hypothetical protein
MAILPPWNSRVYEYIRVEISNDDVLNSVNGTIMNPGVLQDQVADMWRLVSVLRGGDHANAVEAVNAYTSTGVNAYLARLQAGKGSPGSQKVSTETPGDQ